MREVALLRLKTRAQFQAVLSGSVVAKTPHFALHSCGLPMSPVRGDPLTALFPVSAVWLGAMVPKRWAKRAVTRNAIKRQIYVLSAQLHTQLALRAYVVRLRAGFDRTSFVSASSEVLKLAVRQELLRLFETGVRTLAPQGDAT